MAKTIKLVLLVGVIGLVSYLACTGVTIAEAGAWIERQLGINAKKPDLKGVPYHGYVPVVPAK